MAVRGVAAVGLALSLCLATACSKDRDPGTQRPTRPTAPGETTTTTEPGFAGEDHRRGGSARVGVWGAPDPALPTLGGAAVRSLVLPSLFYADPGGRWRPSLVVPGSDVTAPDSRSATLRLRAGSKWSDGRDVSADDLRRTADARFVAGVDGPDPASGVITVRFTQPLPGWRRLWSGGDAIASPGPNVWGGPFVVASFTPGLEAVLRRNDGWRGGRGPFLDEVRLVLVPDPVTARQLLARGELDVVMPPAGTERTNQLEATPEVSVESVNNGGWWVGMFSHPAKVSAGVRRALTASVDRTRFVGTLLRDEAAVLNGFLGPEDAAWASVGPGDVSGARGARGVLLTGELEEPMTQLLQRVMQQRVKPVGSTLDLRNAESDRVEQWLNRGEHEVTIAMAYDPPDMCWVCRWSSVDAGLAAAADAGDRAAGAALEAKLRDEALVLPLWRPKTVVAVRRGLNGVAANGFGLSAAWNAWEWWR